MLIENWRAALDKGELVGLLSTVMSKAYDSVYYPLMQAKLKAYGTGDNSLDLIRSYFSNRFSRVKIGILPVLGRKLPGDWHRAQHLGHSYGICFRMTTRS